MLPGLIISAIALIIILFLVDFKQLSKALQLANYRLVGLFIVISFLWIVVRTFVWHSLLQGSYTKRDVFWAINQGYLLNNLLPFRLGEIGRALLLSNKAVIPIAKKNKSDTGFFFILSTILIERVMDIAMAAGLLLASLPFVVGGLWACQTAIIAIGFILVLFSGLFFLAKNQSWVANHVSSFSEKFQFLQKINHRHINTFFDGLATLTDGKRFLAVTGLMIINWGMAVVQYYVLILAFFPEAKILMATFSLGVLALGIAAPSSPGAVGVMELSMVGALSLFQLDASIALAMAITAHLTNYLLTGSLGVYAFARDGQNISELYQRARSFAQRKEA